MHRTSLASLFLIISLISINIGGTFAQTAGDLQANLDALGAKIQALDKEIADYNKKINSTQGEAKTLKSALASLELRRASLSKEIDKTRLQISQTQANIVTTQTQIGITETKLDKDRRALAETLRTLVYQDETIPPYVRALSKGSRLSDVIDELKRSSDVSHSVSAMVNELAIAKQDLSTQKTIFETNKQKLENLNSMLSGQKQIVDQTAKDKNTLLIQTKNKETEYQKLLADRKTKKESLEAEMLSVESKLKAFTNVSSLPKTGKGVLQYPVASVVVTQTFGSTPFASANPQVYNGGGHNGIDFSAKVGTAILSAADGMVVGTGNTDSSCSGVSYGKWVLVKHNNGLSTLYAHLSVIQVSAGQSVKVGEKIGLSGNTGYSTGPHLHFTVYASESVHIAGPTEYKSKVCGTYLIMPLAPVSGYLNPLSYL
ncbi:MAG: murein hydrolase activator EnvC [Candidatus Paceibacterota bacterium]